MAEGNLGASILVNTQELKMGTEDIEGRKEAQEGEAQEGEVQEGEVQAGEVQEGEVQTGEVQEDIQEAVACNLGAPRIWLL